ncbi:hypothetical protein K431DRAFT_63587 [Polychaeton citri CBS 116435]|uniref:Uncharacterized protein n=1 Tax=Polychaeton citri CBS 116435 TaxID=1314669 RepID=A0A9P4Q700_9PEZI|nr:hypothetical protein K431DRAFT_63587 [Polychaeton citri CBS 116435]
MFVCLILFSSCLTYRAELHKSALFCLLDCHRILSILTRERSRQWIENQTLTIISSPDQFLNVSISPKQVTRLYLANHVPALRSLKALLVFQKPSLRSALVHLEQRLDHAIQRLPSRGGHAGRPDPTQTRARESMAWHGMAVHQLRKLRYQQHISWRGARAHASTAD